MLGYQFVQEVMYLLLLELYVFLQLVVIYVFGVITDDQISNIIDKKLNLKDKDDKE